MHQEKIEKVLEMLKEGDIVAIKTRSCESNSRWRFIAEFTGYDIGNPTKRALLVFDTHEKGSANTCWHYTVDGHCISVWHNYTPMDTNDIIEIKIILRVNIVRHFNHANEFLNEPWIDPDDLI